MKLSGIYAAALMALSVAGISMGTEPMAEFSHSGGRRYAKRRKVKRWKQPSRQHGRKPHK